MTFPSKLEDWMDVHGKIYSRKIKLTNKEADMPLLFFKQV